MNEIEELKEQIEELKKTVAGLQNSTIKIETNVAKLSRMKSEIIQEVFPSDLLEKFGTPRITYLKRDIGIVANEIFFATTEYEYESYKKMAELIFERPEPEKRLETYLGCYRRVCEFMAKEYKDMKEYREKSIEKIKEERGVSA